MAFQKIDVNELPGNLFDLIGTQWMLITGGDKNGFNSMTASWGGAGVLWQKPVAFCFVRPQRHTRTFLDRKSTFTVSFYPEQYREQLALCGAKSGRDIDKVEETGFTPAIADCGAVYYEQARLVLACKKIYTDELKPKNFLEPDIADFYPEHDYHRIYIGEIVEVLEQK
jgi:flavin reductase (DIM6/NTAB) family NADH-FMN oxidoreductase RutF